MATTHHVADVLAQHLCHYKKVHALNYQQQRVCQHIQECRTVKLGTQQWQCDRCEHNKTVYCACRDRHCPQCQGHVSEQWSEQQSKDVINAPYFHLVFTLPHELNGLARQYPREIYSCLFSAVWQTLSQFAQRKKQLQGTLGMTAVLHTWGQSLAQHIHLHCLIPGGVLTSSGEWRGVEKPYLFAVKALATVFRAKMLAAIRAHKLTIPQSELLMTKSWCVHSKVNLTEPKTVLKYLGRYTRKGMLHEGRLKQVTKEDVTFSYKDYRDSKIKRMTLTGIEFIRRYLLHVLPSGFMRIRHYGFLASACRAKKRDIISAQTGKYEAVNQEKSETTVPVSVNWPCPSCKQGQLIMKSLCAKDIKTNGLTTQGITMNSG